jgi:hypothetical protein
MTALLLFAIIGQLPADPTADAAPEFAPADIEFFEKKVRPILVQRCYECHSPQKDPPEANLLLDRREGDLKGGDVGPAAVAGDPEKSALVRGIRYNDAELQMPPTGKLPDGEIEILTEWIRRGLPFPKTDAAEVSRRTIDIAAGRKHWAFQPVQRPPLPTIGNPQAEIRNSLDAFILARLDDVGLSPSPPADRRTLIRRAKFDLLGLPPSPDEIDAFAADGAPDAYERLVDRYLASPHYGERWGRHWLDLARYCDVPESWREGDAQAWLYRDWVIGAFNRDVPYDDFVRQQLAADLLPGATPADNAALGYLGLSPTYWKELKLDHTVIKQVVAEEWEERIEAVGATFLGLTLACARCHDHKFDPLTQQDYYALAGVLASSNLEDRPIIAADLAGPAAEARKKAKELQAAADKLAEMKEPTEEQRQQLDSLRKQIGELKQTPHYETPLAFSVSEASLIVLPDGEHRTKIEYRAGEAQDVPMHIRGNAAKPGPVVPRRFVSVLTSDPPAPFQSGSGRRELAEAIVTDAAPLAARVIVNRVWMHHFGRGLVTTPSNFGIQGDRPSHPELLGDLAARFIETDWSLKWLHREIMLSGTYQQASALDTAKNAADPENVWLWRMKPRRLEVEAWRDAMLAAGGDLDLQIGGPALDLESAENRRRTVYGRVKRRELADVLRLHDFPDPIAHAAQRVPTTTPLQQLFTLNSPLIRQRSEALAARLAREAPADDDSRVAWLYRELFGREASAGELAAGRRLLAAAGEGGSAAEAWREYCQVLLGGNELLFVD